MILCSAVRLLILYIVYIDSNFGDETQKILASQTDWDQKGFWYFTPTSKRDWDRIRDNNYFVIVTWYNKKTKDFKVELQQVTDYVQLQTPDGRYFIAHKQVRGTRSVRLQNIAGKLKSVGLSLKAIKKEPALTLRQNELIFEMLRVPKRLRHEIGNTR